MEMWKNYVSMSRAYAETASLGGIMGDIIAIVIGAILVASMLPTALTSFYKVNTGWFVYGGGSTGTNDTATVAIFNLLPLFAVLRGLALMIAPVIKHFGSQ